MIVEAVPSCWGRGSYPLDDVLVGPPFLGFWSLDEVGLDTITFDFSVPVVS